jgi:hypothetical protein
MKTKSHKVFNLRRNEKSLYNCMTKVKLFHHLIHCLSEFFVKIKFILEFEIKDFKIPFYNSTFVKFIQNFNHILYQEIKIS